MDRINKRIYYWLLSYLIIGGVILFLAYLYALKLNVPVILTLGFGLLFFTVFSASFGFILWWVYNKNNHKVTKEISPQGFLRIFALTILARFGLFIILSALIWKNSWEFGYFLYILFLIYFFYSLFFELIPVVVFQSKQE